MKFWDASAVIPLLLHQPATARMQALQREDSSHIAWWGTVIESHSAIARLLRERYLDAVRAAESRARLLALAASWREISPDAAIRDRACALLVRHPLRAVDALQLAAAGAAADGDPGSLPFVCLDDRLRVAARREGFPVLP